MEDEQWLFCGCVLMLEEYDGSTSTAWCLPAKFKAWIQIQKLPPLYRTKHILKQLASKVGEVLMVDIKAVSTSTGNFHQARVNLPAACQLVRVVILSLEGSESIMLQVKYEKVAHFYAYCGLECGTSEHEEEDLQHGEWMVAPSETRRSGTPWVRDFFELEKGVS